MENKIYTNEEFRELVAFANTVKDFIPEDKASYVWNNYKKISGDNSKQPCSCGSSASHWRRAMEGIREYIKQNAEKYND